MAVTKPANGWRYEDLFDLPDNGRRYEIIGGELYEMPSPTSAHAGAIMNLIVLLAPVLTRLGARLFTAPLDVFFADADPVQPDLLVLMPERLGLVAKRGIEGAPDLVIEVLSPSNPEHDRITKRAVYARGGVREYWLVSPEAATIEVLALAEDGFRLHLRAGGDEAVTSTVLPELSFPASAVFAPGLPR